MPLSPGGWASKLAELSGLVFRPGACEPIPVVTRQGPVLDPTRPFRVATWNVQYAASRSARFFYDGGDAVHVDPGVQSRTIEALSREISAMEPDILLIQELDRDSARTQRVDQLARLQERLGYPTQVSAAYHRSRHVPHPAHAHLGRIELHMAMIAQVAVTSAVRIQLPLLREPRWRRAFNLKRCLLHVVVPVVGQPPLHIGLTHLSAFSGGDGTLPAQVGVLVEWMEARRRAGESFVVGGDLNVLPPGDLPARLGAEAVDYTDGPACIAALLEHSRSVISPDNMLKPEFYTYIPWGATAPDRVLDYLFVSDDVEVLDAGLWQQAELLSDHLPLLATLRLRRP